MSEPKSPFSTAGGRQLGTLLARLARQTGKQRGFAIAQVLTRWPEIAGDSLAGVCAPERLTFPTGKTAEAVLTIRVEPGFAPMVQHRTPEILSRINQYYGYRAVARLRLRQAPLAKSRRRRAPPPAPVSPQIQAEIAGQVAGISNPNLRAALEGLGKVIKTRTK